MFFKQAIAALSESGARYCVVGGLAVVGNLTVPLISIPDLIQMKRRSDRAQDLADVAHLEQLVTRDA
jgi:hypothetical protein